MRIQHMKTKVYTWVEYSEKTGTFRSLQFPAFGWSSRSRQDFLTVFQVSRRSSVLRWSTPRSGRRERHFPPNRARYRPQLMCTHLGCAVPRTDWLGEVLQTWIHVSVVLLIDRKHFFFLFVKAKCYGSIKITHTPPCRSIDYRCEDGHFLGWYVHPGIIGWKTLVWCSLMWESRW